MSDPNKAPFSWSDLTNKIVWAIVAALAVWIYQTHNRVTQLEDYERTKTIFWQIHSQQRNAFNNLVIELNDRREPGTPKFERLQWDINPDEQE